MQPAVIAGYRVLLKLNNTTYGAGFVMDYDISTSASSIDGIDNTLPLELAPERIIVSMTVRIYRTPSNDPVQDRFAPLGAGSNPHADFVKSPYISVEIRDKVTDTTVIFLPQAWVVRRSGSVEAENVLTETLSIKSIGYIGPTGQVSGVAGALSSAIGAIGSLFG